jgi:large subunit ribosomal protein L21
MSSAIRSRLLLCGSKAVQRSVLRPAGVSNLVKSPYAVSSSLSFSTAVSTEESVAASVKKSLSGRSVVHHPFPIDGNPLDSALRTESKDLFAIAEFSGTQFKLAVDDTLVADKIEGVDIGETIDISDVLLVGSRKATVVGRPFVAGAKVLAAVEEITKDKHLITLKFRRRKNSQTKRGFRREVTILRVTDIITSSEDAEVL